MTNALASFSELTGVGPVAEARLHEAGVRSWAALATVLAALDGARSSGRDPLRRLSRQVAERATEWDAANDGERSEAFIVRLALADTGRPLRTRVTHARTSAEHVRAGWNPDDVVRFVEDCTGLWESTPLHEAEEQFVLTDDADHSPADTTGDDEPGRSSREHVVDVDAGRFVGGSPRDIDLRLSVVPPVPQDLRIVAHLGSRAFGLGGSGTGERPWTDLVHRAADVDRSGLIALRFEDVSLPRDLHRLRLRVTVQLTEPSTVPPAITLR